MMSGGGGGVNKSVFKRVRERIGAGERYTVNDSGGGCITAGQQWRFWGVKNFRREFIFDPCHVSLAPWNSKTGLGIKTGPFKYECADVYIYK